YAKTFAIVVATRTQSAARAVAARATSAATCRSHTMTVSEPIGGTTLGRGASPLQPASYRRVKGLDRVLQRWRIAVAAPWIPPGARVLDIGCADGALFDVLRGRIAGGVGIDPDAPAGQPRTGVRLVRGLFPADAPDERFDVITMLAVIEHLPSDSYSAVGGVAARL